MGTNLLTANDNMPLGNMGHPGSMAGSSGDSSGNSMLNHRWHSGDLISVSEYSPVKRGVRIQHTHVPAAVSTGKTSGTSNKTKRKKTGHKKTGKFPVYVLLLLWLAGVAVIARFAGGLNDNLLSGQSLAIAGGVLGLLSLLLASTARRRNAKISHSIGIAGAGVCVSGLVLYYLYSAGIKTTPEFLLLSVAASSLVLAKLWRTPFLLHLSLLLAIGWSSYSFMNSQVSELAWLFPALWSVQMFLALEFRIRRTIALSIFSGLLWIGVNLFLLA